MIYHLYKTDCYRATRVLMQSQWDGESIFIHNSKDDDYKINKKFGVKALFDVIVGSHTDDTIVFHAQSALPYVILAYIIKSLMRKSMNFVYDIHDLHEWRAENTIFSKNYVRYVVLNLFERLVFSILKIKKMTVSEGLARLMQEKYNKNSISVVRSVSKDKGFRGDGDNFQDAILFFGIKEHAPIGLFAAIRAAGLDLHMYGRDMTPEWLLKVAGEGVDHIKLFGEYMPTNMHFLSKYKVLVLYPENRTLNYKYALPNKLFQAIDYGVRVVISDFFEETLSLFKDSPNFVLPASENDVIDTLVRALGSPDSGAWNDAKKIRDAAYNEARLNYMSCVGVIN